MPIMDRVRIGVGATVTTVTTGAIGAIGKSKFASWG